MPNPINNTTVVDQENPNINRQISKVDFDVAITVGNSDKVEAGAKAGIQIFSAKIGGGNEEHTENVSRITFAIPVVLPTINLKTKAQFNDEKVRETLRNYRHGQ